MGKALGARSDRNAPSNHHGPPASYPRNNRAQGAAVTGFPGDGKILVNPVDRAYTIRTGKAEL
jgi:hypothetical protein